MPDTDPPDADTPSPEDDTELLAAWRSGDNDAGRVLFERHFTAIYRFFRSKVPDAADDLTQQTFLGCVRGLDAYRGNASFRTYLFTIARNRLFTFLRDRGRRDRLFSPAEDSVADLPLLSGGDPALDRIAAGQESRLLLAALRRLPLDQQIVLELHYWEDLKVREIAEIVDDQENTVKRRLQRARARLEELITEIADSDALARSTVDGIDAWAKRLRVQLGRTVAD